MYANCTIEALPNGLWMVFNFGTKGKKLFKTEAEALRHAERIG